MNPGQAWRAASLIIVLAVVVAAALLANMGFDALQVGIIGTIVLMIYAYVLYKRYNVEVVPESDIALFDDPDDLRILCKIYGVDAGGDEAQLRKSLVDFVRGNTGKAFTWVAPRAVLALGTAFELSTPEGGPQARPPSEQGLVGGRLRSASRLSKIRSCPVCDAGTSPGGKICPECGADIEFYEALNETKVGRRFLSHKNVAVRRKLRYGVPSLGDKR